MNGGVNIKPLPRKSIHIHCGECPFLFNEKMVRYGINSHSTRHQSHSNVDTQENQGNDVVDNAMSKFAYTTSPLLNRRNDYLRRNSVDVPNDKYSSDSDSDIKSLSKSSPALFSSLYYSDESYRSTNENGCDTSGNVSRISSNAASSPINRHNNKKNVSSQSQNVTLVQSPHKLANQYDNSILTTTYLLIVLIIVLAVGVAYYKNYFNNSIGINKYVYDEFSFYNDVKRLGEKYRVNDNSMLQIKSGITTISEKEDTGSFIFAYNSQTNDFNALVFNDFMKEISSTTARYLRNETKTGHHVVVDTTNIKTDAELMNLYREDVDRTGVMLVDLSDITSQLAMAFHYYCDEYNPLVKRSAIFFTLNLATCTVSSDRKSSHKYIEKCLATKWHNVQEDKIGPLLTRVVNIVIDVTSI